MPPGSGKAVAGRQTGFTLLEMLIVLAVVGLMAGIIALRGQPRSAALDLRQAVAELAGSLRVARAQAIARNQPVPVRLSADGTALAVGDAPGRRLPPGIRAVSVPRLIVFRPDGSASGGTIELAGPARTARIGVDWLTGRVSAGP